MQSAQVNYSLSIHDAATGREISRLPIKKNLILDQGLDGIAVRSWAASFTHAVIGTGTTPTKRDSGAVTVSRSGSTLTASAGFFEAADVGRLFKFDTGEEVRITAYSSATQVTTAGTGAIAAAEGTVWYVNQTGLTTETKRSNTYSNDGGANGSSYTAGTWTHKRTFIFSAETGTINYREIGWSHTASAGPNLFGRDLLAGAGVTLVAGQQLRVVVELSVSYSPVSAVAYTSVVSGWSQAGTMGIETCNPIGVDTAGGTQSGSRNMDPSTQGSIALATDSTAIRNASVNSQNFSGLIAGKGATLSTYAAGSFSREKFSNFTVSEGNSTAIRSIVYYGGSTSDFRVLLNAAETKTSDQTLTISFGFTWGRILNNA